MGEFKSTTGFIFVSTQGVEWWSGPHGPITGDFVSWTGQLDGHTDTGQAYISADFLGWTADIVAAQQNPMMLFVPAVTGVTEAVENLVPPNISLNHFVTTFLDGNLRYYELLENSGPADPPNIFDATDGSGNQWNLRSKKSNSILYQQTGSLAAGQSITVTHEADSLYGRLVTVFFDNKTSLKAAIYFSDTSTVVYNGTGATVNAIVNVLI